MNQDANPPGVIGMGGVVMVTHPGFLKTQQFIPSQVGLLQNTNLWAIEFQEFKNRDIFTEEFKPLVLQETILQLTIIIRQIEVQHNGQR